MPGNFFDPQINAEVSDMEGYISEAAGIGSIVKADIWLSVILQIVVTDDDLVTGFHKTSSFC